MSTKAFSFAIILLFTLYFGIGIIPHSARPPSANFSGARLSFAVKISRNEWTARLKNIREILGRLTVLRTLLLSIKNTSNQDNEEDGNVIS